MRATLASGGFVAVRFTAQKSNRGGAMPDVASIFRWVKNSICFQKGGLK
ncbi:MAG: hypothetical protein ABIL40_09655 [candidate division WOR-3 bacterium]